MLLWHHALRPSSAKVGALVAAGASGACLAVLEAPGAGAPERVSALGILLGVARAGEAGRMDVAGARTARVRLRNGMRTPRGCARFRHAELPEQLHAGAAACRTILMGRQLQGQPHRCSGGIHSTTALYLLF